MQDLRVQASHTVTQFVSRTKQSRKTKQVVTDFFISEKSLCSVVDKCKKVQELNFPFLKY